MNVSDILGPGFAGASDHEQLVRTARELETVVLTQMMSAMRKTVPEGGLFQSSLSDDVFRSMLDEEIARATAEKSPFGLADAIVKSLENRVKEPSGSTEMPNEAAPPPDGAFRRIG